MPTQIRSFGKSARLGKSLKAKKTTVPAKKRAASPSGKHKTRKSTSHAGRSSSSSAPTDKVAANALKFIDQAAELLREGVITGTSQSAHVRHAARKKAQKLIEKAHTSLGEALDMGTSALYKMLGKI